MTFDTFIESASQSDAPPANISDVLCAMWWAEKGDWEASHDIAQDVNSKDGSWIHAFLHRWEGDAGNARYWYARAGKPECHDSLDQERHDIIRALLA